MNSARKTNRTCPHGHVCFKSSDCPTCPQCEKEHVSLPAFLNQIGAPARRALEREGILSEESLSKYSEKEILVFHGIGKTSIPILREALNRKGLTFKERKKLGV